MYLRRSLIVLLVGACTAVLAQDAVEQVYEECATNVACAERKFVELINAVDEQSSVALLDGVVTLVKKPAAAAAASVGPRPGEGLLERAARFVAEHEVRLQTPGVVQRAARALVSDARSKKLRRILLPIILLLKLKAIIVIPIVLTVIGLLALKGLGAGFAALALSGFSALKSILDGKSSTQRITYGVVQIPHEPHWSRTGAAMPVDYAEVDPYLRTMPQ